MTTALAINDENDIYIDGANNIALVTGQTAVKQAAQTTSRAQLGEMILFTTQGMPALQNVFNANPNLAVYQAAVVAAIEQIYGVISVQSIVFTKTETVLSYIAVIQSIYGELTING